MRRFSRRISTQEVVAKVKDILAGKPPSLITGFNLFLPTEYHIKPQKFDCALGMVKKIRDRFGRTEPSVLESFVEILVRSQEDSIAMVEARNQVRELFRGQDDLLQDFNSFIPEADESDSSSVIFKRMETGGCNIGSKHGLQDGGEKISAADKVGGSGQAKRKSMHKGMGDGGTSCKPGRGGEEPSHRRRLANISRPNVSGSSTSSGKVTFFITPFLTSSAKWASLHLLCEVQKLCEQV